MALDRGSALGRLTLERPTLEAARTLLGVMLVRDDATGLRVGRIVEVEAYIGEDDRASHARFGRTPRNDVMYGRPGLAYVYLVYGMYDCLNVVTEPQGRPAAVLIRAVEPVAGVDLMRADRMRWLARLRAADGDARSRAASRVRQLEPTRLASGPGLVGAAYGLDPTWTGVDLCDPGSPLRLEQPTPPPDPATVVASPRVGIGYAGAPWTTLPWRLSLAGHRSVSRPPAEPPGV